MNMLTRCGMRNGTSPLSTVFDRVFNDAFFTDFTPVVRVQDEALAIDLSEDDANVIIRASLPGFTRDQVEAQVHEGVLTITAQRGEEHEETGERYYRRERRHGALTRRIALPDSVAADAEAQAELRDGVLTLRLPKSPNEQPRKIRIG